MTVARTLLAALALVFVCCMPSSAQTSFTRVGIIAETLRLTEEQRYADAVIMAEKMRQVNKDDVLSFETHGAVALQVGAISVATRDFHDALVRSPDDPLALYGTALVQMVRGQYLSAQTFLDKIDCSTLPLAAVQEIDNARAACYWESGRPLSVVLQPLSGSSDPTALEISALSKFRADGSATDLKDCLALAMVDGIPGVVEPPGLRLLLPFNHTGPMIEPSIIDKETQQNLLSRFNTSTAPGALKMVTGSISLTPPRPTPPGTIYVDLSVDNTQVGVTNAAPYLFEWDTAAFANGVHCLTFAMMSGTGVQIGIQDEYLSVFNAAVPSQAATELPDPQLIARIWNALKIQPDYKVAEYELAIALQKATDHDGYETHILRAAALDPDYRDVRSRIHPLFFGTVPNTFPVPDGTTLPSSLGLSAGSASTAGFWAGSPKVREIALTFDDGPLPIPTEQLLAALKTAGACGTFFVVGMRAAESPDSLRHMAADGNAVEDHTYTHPNLTQILPQHILLEILRTAVVIQATTGNWPHFLRPPGGNTNPLVLETAKICGMSGAFWTIDALPAEESGSSDEVSQWVLSRARPGAIVLMHNGMDATIAAIPELVAGLREKGYKLVTIRQLAADALAGGRHGS